jgi:hypothetical protein
MMEIFGRIKSSKKTKTMKVSGTLCIYAETGTEGAYWAVQEDGVGGYEGLTTFGDIDVDYHLQIFVYDDDGEKQCIFDGGVTFIPSFLAYEDYPYFGKYWKKWRSGYSGQFVLAGYWCHHLPMGIDLGFWEELISGKLPHKAVVTMKMTPSEYKSQMDIKKSIREYLQGD